MRMHNLTSAFLIAMLTAGALHVSVQPAAAAEHDDKSICAKIAAAEMKIENKNCAGYRERTCNRRALRFEEGGGLRTDVIGYGASWHAPLRKPRGVSPFTFSFIGGSTMRQLTNLGSALVVALLVAGGMVTFSAPIEAAGPGGGRSNEVLCTLLANAEAAAPALPDGDFKTELAREHQRAAGSARLRPQ